MAKFQWVRVSGHTPCPVCKRPDWCRVSADGAVAGCMRVEQGSFRAREGRDGSKVYLHRLNGAPMPDADVPVRLGPEARRADADSLHEVYSALLARLTLSTAHREALRQRGLSDEGIERCGYRTLPAHGRPRVVRDLRERFEDRVLRVPGFVVKEGRSGRYLTLRGPAGLVVPCRDLAGRVVALKVRREESGEGGRRYAYVSSAGHGGPGPAGAVHCPVGTPTTAELVRLTEGELKADVVQALTGLPTVSVPGVAGWRPALAVLAAMRCKAARLAFDADGWDKVTVARSLSGCAGALLEAGVAVELERWDPADGKGLDDLLAAGKVAEVLRGDAARQAIGDMLASASAHDEPAPPDELARLQDVLEAGGAEALFRDGELMQALADLREANPAGFAAVRASLRERVSVRDLDNALRSLRRQGQPGVGAECPAYFEDNGCVHRNVQTRDGPVPVPLCNFTARIVEDVVHDDGAEQSRFLALEGTLFGGATLPRAEVPAADFAAMGWVVPAWGTRAVVYAGQGTKDHLRAALQLLSGDVPRRTVYAHLGWREVEGAWAYLHAAGGVGADGHVEVAVSLPPALAGYTLPAPLAPVAADVALAYGTLGRAARDESAELCSAVRAGLGLLGLGPDRLTFPLLAAPYRAVLGDCDFALHLSGPTGSYKSEAAALAQQHFGAGLDARHLPASWSSTGNALEGLAFAAKDALLCVDDFCPAGSAADVQRYHKEADRLFRGQGNHAGRLRMRADGALRPAKPPRGLVLSTGEDVPRGQSLRARLLVLEVSPGDLGPLPPEPNPALSACQKEAAAGKYAVALAGFLRWLAPRYDVVRAGLRGELEGLRGRARAEGQHARTPGIVADLALGLRYLLEFARDVGAVTEEEKDDLWERGWDALSLAGQGQADHIASAEPARLFLRLLSAALAGGYAHVADPDGNAPPEPQRWGWRSEESHGRDGAVCRPQGRRVGWLADGQLYLEPDTSFAVVQTVAGDQGEAFAVTATTLRRRLKEKELLASTEAARGKLTVRRTLQGERRDVLHVSRSGTLFAPAHRGEAGAEAAGGPEPGAGCWAGNGHPGGGSARENRPVCQETSLVGRLGRSDAGEEGVVAGVSRNGQPDGWGDWQ